MKVKLCTWGLCLIFLCVGIVHGRPVDQDESVADTPEPDKVSYGGPSYLEPEADPMMHYPEKRKLHNVLRFGKRMQTALRFGKKSYPRQYDANRKQAEFGKRHYKNMMRYGRTFEAKPDADLADDVTELKRGFFSGHRPQALYFGR